MLYKICKDKEVHYEKLHYKHHINIIPDGSDSFIHHKSDNCNNLLGSTHYNLCSSKC